MGIAEDILGEAGWHAALAALAWQYDLGATEAMLDAPVNRYALPEALPKVAVPQAVAPVVAVAQLAVADPVAVAAARAAAADRLEDLRAALEGFDLCEMKRGAKRTVFADGTLGARVMVIGEAPDRDEDGEGRPFVGRAGQLLDRMFAAIGLARQASERARGVYLVNVLPWRPPQDRDPLADEIALMRPFLERHVALANPDLIVLMGNSPCQAVLGRRGISRMRGEWAVGFGRPVLPMLHPAALLRAPEAKREAWADLLSLQARLRGDRG